MGDRIFPSRLAFLGKIISSPVGFEGGSFTGLQNPQIWGPLVQSWWGEAEPLPDTTLCRGGAGAGVRSGMGVLTNGRGAGGSDSVAAQGCLQPAGV